MIKIWTKKYFIEIIYLFDMVDPSVLTNLSVPGENYSHWLESNLNRWTLESEEFAIPSGNKRYWRYDLWIACFSSTQSFFRLQGSHISAENVCREKFLLPKENFLPPSENAIAHQKFLSSAENQYKCPLCRCAWLWCVQDKWESSSTIDTFATRHHWISQQMQAFDRIACYAHGRWIQWRVNSSNYIDIHPMSCECW